MYFEGFLDFIQKRMLIVEARMSGIDSRRHDSNRVKGTLEGLLKDCIMDAEHRSHSTHWADEISLPEESKAGPSK